MNSSSDLGKAASSDAASDLRPAGGTVGVGSFISTLGRPNVEIQDPPPTARFGTTRAIADSRRTCRSALFQRHMSDFLHNQPALCLFLSIFLGTIIGRVHVKGVGFGSVVGTLIA